MNIFLKLSIRGPFKFYRRMVRYQSSVERIYIGFSSAKLFSRIPLRGFKRRRISPGGPSRTQRFKGEPVSARSDLPAPGRASKLLRIFSFHLRSRGRRGLTLFVDPPSTTPYSTLLIYLDLSPLPPPVREHLYIVLLSRG